LKKVPEKRRIKKIYQFLNPVGLKRIIDKKLNLLYKQSLSEKTK